jgi:hypothetical protein
MPSKYDAVSEKLNDVAMNGFAEEEYGSCQEEGFWSALIITDDLYGIIQEDDQGFVDYEVHDTEDEVRGRWSAMMSKWESAFNPETVYA